MDRRTFVETMAYGLLVVCRAAWAQQSSKVWRIGYVHLRSGPSERDEAFRTELRRLGYVEGQNLVIVDRWTSGAVDRLPDIASEYVTLKVDAIVVSSRQAAEASRRATSTIPIVMSGVLDPVGNGLVQTLARPGGNVTGMSSMITDLSGKRMELLHDLLPKATRIGVLIVGLSFGDAQQSLEPIRAVAQRLKLELITEYANTASAFAGAIEAIGQKGAQGLIFLRSGPGAIDNRKLLVALITKQRLPAIYDIQEFVNAGGLMSYGYNVSELYRRAANYLDRIFKGAKPEELPVEQPTTFELVINAKAAQEIDLKVPQSLLLRADRVIQ